MGFKTGQSGNPKGRPRGSIDKRTIFRGMIEPHSELLINKAIQMALDGNEAMLRLLLERILPVKLREDPVSIDITSDSLAGRTTKIIAGLSSGNITIGMAKTLMDTVATEVKIIEHDILEKRLTEVEQAIKIGVHAHEWIEE